MEPKDIKDIMELILKNWGISFNKDYSPESNSAEVKKDPEFSDFEIIENDKQTEQKLLKEEK